MENQSESRGQIEKSAKYFLLIFALSVMVIAALVAAVNLKAYQYMLLEKNQSIVQLLAGWGRMYKPILYDQIKPEVSIYGASWARDAFDPIETGKLIGMTVFNHGVSGSTSYESRRFVDSSLDNPNLKAAIINLDTFVLSELEALNRFGFDESILDVDPELKPNSWVSLRRAYLLALSGGAAGANIQLISTILARDSGADLPEYLEAYEQMNMANHESALVRTRNRIFPPSVTQQSEFAANASPKIFQPADLGLVLDNLCANNIDIYAYFTPTHSRTKQCDLTAHKELQTLNFLRSRQNNCKARIQYFNFSYPNVITLEAVLSPNKLSYYYRPDKHPRPTVGLLMAAQMFESDFPDDTPTLAKEDFGVDLLSHDDPEQWLIARAARCEGDWGEDGFEDYIAELGK